MTQVIFLWFEDGSIAHYRQHVAWLPECPAVGTTVHVPLGESDERGRTDMENSQAMEVHRVAWTCDGTPTWHAEVQLR